MGRKLSAASAESDGEALPFVTSQIARDRAVRRSELLRRSKFSAVDISNVVSRLVAEGKMVLAGDFAVDTAPWRAMCRRAADAIDARHRAHPEQTGLSLSDLRAILEPDLPFADLFEPLAVDLCRSEFVQVGSAIRRAKHRPALPPLLKRQPQNCALRSGPNRLIRLRGSSLRPIPSHNRPCGS